MDRNVAEKLVLELKKHPRVSSIAKEFVGALMSVGVKDSLRFYEEIPSNQELLDDGGKYHCLSLRRVLRNKNAFLKEVSELKLVGRYLAEKLHIYSSDICQEI